MFHKRERAKPQAERHITLISQTELPYIAAKVGASRDVPVNPEPPKPQNPEPLKPQGP